MQGQALPGFRDFYPDDLSLRNPIFPTWRSVATRYGFEEYDGPPLEPLELYTQKSGEEIAGQLYEFTDKGDRRVALRPEMTPTLARMVGARAQALKKPIRWFSIPQLFRYERQQRGRLREHFQLNMDLIGEAGPLADAGLIAAAIDILRGFGFGPQDVKARVSDRRGGRGVVPAPGGRGGAGPRAVLGPDKGGRGAPGLGEAGRGLGGVDLPALGFGMGDVVLGELLRERKSSFEAPGQLDAFLVAVSGEDVAPVLKLAHELRDRGIAVEYGLRHAAVRKQLELAAARGAPRAIIIGPDERKAGVAVVRDLATGTEKNVPLTALESEWRK